ncbi:Sterol O-acyltransferase 2 [Grifola frondosa]|uniref:Sterol O-acyltransferase 2 n=1 Tax=Grifola frondosa TaxID=5627 RepID=A0A1C7MGB5_GRIFR|nr:Sterol O-acyltransferase 2 [Grifola frondosa]
MISFAPRKSHFDISNEQSFSNEFRGFFSLFWVSMLIFAVRTYVRSIEANGYALELSFATMFSRDAVTLALSDAVLVGSTALCVPFAKASPKAHPVLLYRRHHPGPLAAPRPGHRHHMDLQPTVALGPIWLPHPPLSHDDYEDAFLHGHERRAPVHPHSGRAHPRGPRAATDDEGGWDAALAAAEANIERTSSAESGTPTIPDETGTTTSTSTRAPRSLSRQRLAAQASCAEKASGTRVLLPAPRSCYTAPSPSEILAHHPSERIAALARAHVELDRELVGTVEGACAGRRTSRSRTSWCPDDSYTRTAAFLGTFALLYTVTESFILPLTPTPWQPFLDSLLDLALPFMMAYLLLFYIIFECICNGSRSCLTSQIGSSTTIGWNSTSWEEFSRKWNRPVHTFLLRHVYASSMSNYKLSRRSAMFLTFALSAAAHELVMAVVTKKIRFYLFAMQLAQLPLIAIGRIPAIRRNKLLGNIVFWLLDMGLPCLASSSTTTISYYRFSSMQYNLSQEDVDAAVNSVQLPRDWVDLPRADIALLVDYIAEQGGISAQEIERCRAARRASTQVKAACQISSGVGAQFSPPVCMLPQSMHAAMFERGWHMLDVHPDAPYRPCGIAVSRIIDNWLWPLIALFEGRIVDLSKTIVGAGPYCAGITVEHEVVMTGCTFFLIGELKRGPDNAENLAEFLGALSAAAEANKDFPHVRVHGLLTDMTRFRFCSYDPATRTFCADEELLADVEREHFCTDMIAVANKMFSIIMFAYLEVLREMVDSSREEDAGNPSSSQDQQSATLLSEVDKPSLHSRPSFAQREQALHFAEQASAKFQSSTSIDELDAATVEGLRLLTESAHCLPRVSPCTATEVPSTAEGLQALSDRNVKEWHERLIKVYTSHED